MVVMDRQDYINKANHLLNQSTFKVMTKDPTNTIKNKLINILKGIKTKTGLGINTYKSMYPTGCVPPKLYGPPKIHKPDTPLRPIVSGCGSVTYGVAKELAKILPLTSSRIYWTRTPPSRKELLWKLGTLSSYWSSVSRTPTSLFKVSSKNRLRVLPWVPQLAPL